MIDLLHNLQYKIMDYGFHMTITEWDEVVSKEMEIMVMEKGCFSYIFCLYCTDFILHWTLVNTSLISFLSISHEICLSFHVCANFYRYKLFQVLQKQVLTKHPS